MKTAKKQKKGMRYRMKYPVPGNFSRIPTQA
jgi:hypothetical protein